jgi:hypothetical protein
MDITCYVIILVVKQLLVWETMIQIMASFCWIVWMCVIYLSISISLMQFRPHDSGMKFLHGYTYLFRYLLCLIM